MDSSTLLTIYLPIFIVYIAIFSQQSAIRRLSILKKRKRKEGNIMTNELLKKYIGENCRLTTGTFGITINGKIVSVNENWIEIETKKGKELLNAEFIQNIKIK